MLSSEAPTTTSTGSREESMTEISSEEDNSQQMMSASCWTNSSGPSSENNTQSVQTMPLLFLRPGFTGRKPQVVYNCCNDNIFSSQYDLLIRNQVEYFEVNHMDIHNSNTNEDGRPKPTFVGQVGIRCRHCAAIPVQQRTTGAVQYPNKWLDIEETCRNMIPFHILDHCPLVPTHVRENIVQLRDVVYPPRVLPEFFQGKNLWILAAKVLGVYEDLADNVLRFDPTWKLSRNQMVSIQKAEEMSIQSFGRLIENVTQMM